MRIRNASLPQGQARSGYEDDDDLQLCSNQLAHTDQPIGKCHNLFLKTCLY